MRAAARILPLILWTGIMAAGCKPSAEVGMVQLPPGYMSEHSVHLLGDYDVGSGEYALLGLAEESTRHPIKQRLGDFYVDAPELLNRIRERWITGGAAPLYKCGYHYNMILLRKGVQVDSFAINLDTGCATVVTKDGSRYFYGTLLQEFADEYRHPVRERKRFASFEDGRAYLDTIEDDKRLLMVVEPEWREYDGELGFEEGCPGYTFGPGQADQCLERARSRIAARFPEASFELSRAGGVSGGGESAVYIEMRCSRRLYEQLGMGADQLRGRWRDYEPALIIYWKRANLLQALRPALSGDGFAA